MENNKKPADFNWVKERSECSVQLMFEKLKRAIHEDAEKMNEALKNEIPPRKFRIMQQTKYLKVFEEDNFNDHPPSVEFKLSNKTIKVVNGATDEPLFDVTIGLNADGDCKFKIGDKELDCWQVRRQALEPLFFRA